MAAVPTLLSVNGCGGGQTIGAWTITPNLDIYLGTRYLYEITLLPPPVGTGWLCHKLLSTDTDGRPWTLYSIENRYGRNCEHDKPMENRSGFVVCTWLISYKQLTQASPLIGAYATLPWSWRTWLPLTGPMSLPYSCLSIEPPRLRRTFI